MSSRSYTQPLALLLLLTVPSCLGRSIATRAANATTCNEDVAKALIYAYPLTLYVQTFYNTTADLGTNILNRGNQTSTASDPVLVRPNANYIYSPVAIDLSHDNIELTLPLVPDGRSYVFPFYDLYGDNYANLGSATNSPAGTYLVRLDYDAAPGVVMKDANFPEYEGVISSSTAWGSLMIRIVTFGNTTDLDAVLVIENQAHLTPVKRSGKPSGPALTTEALQPSNALSAAAFKAPYGLTTFEVTNVLSLMAAAAEYNPPGNISAREGVSEMLSAAGLCNGVYTPQPELNITLANSIIEKRFATVLQRGPNYIDLGGDWVDGVPAVSGDFGDHHVIRADIAYTGYLQLVSTEAIYPEYIEPSTPNGLLRVGTNESYIFRFSSAPPTAFWSLTAYAENYLIPNSLNRYSLYEESGITYPDGMLVYGNDSSRDGPFDLLIQAAGVNPPKNWTSNWLPAPAHGGYFNVNLRCYGPTAALSNLSYVYPVVTRQAAYT